MYFSDFTKHSYLRNNEECREVVMLVNVTRCLHLGKCKISLFQDSISRNLVLRKFRMC